MDEPLSHDSFAGRLTDKQLHCRELGHVWRPFTASYEPDARAYVRTLRCSSCRTERHQVLDSSGHVISNGYSYPNGYLAANVAPGLTRDTFRLEAVMRFLHERERRLG
jgi:hypothetical protein